MVCHVVNRTYNQRRKAIPYTLMTGLTGLAKMGCTELIAEDDPLVRKTGVIPLISGPLMFLHVLSSARDA